MPTSTIIARAAAALKSRLLKDTSVILLGFGLQLVTQISWFVIISWRLGPAGYGTFASLTAITSIVACLVGWGCDQILVRNVASDRRQLNLYLGHGLATVAWTSALFAGVCLLLIPMIKAGALPRTALLAVIVADLFFGRVLTLCSTVYMATERAWRQTMIWSGSGVLKMLAAIGAALLSPNFTVEVWAYWYTASSVIAGVAAFALVTRDFGWPRFRWMPAELAGGTAFCLEFALLAALKDMDKPIVAQYAGAAAAGNYAAAYRLVDTMGTPLRALSTAAYARFFRHAATSSTHSLEFGRRVVVWAAAIAGLGSVALFLGADLLPFLLGRAYDGLPQIARALALFPFFTAIYVIGADVLTSIGMQRYRMMIVFGSLVSTTVLTIAAVKLGGPVAVGAVRVAILAVMSAVVWRLSDKGSEAETAEPASIAPLATPARNGN